ncbi:general transcription factor 3C polypeptide 4 isoform X2 [Rhineura floridana]|uniref:general transcription factor 3C polypeptide 4 isoform X2 n=1 Tax=Rhineura floridana TaxID=261503 RepID=UPI002AC82B83|nr:general transcription factor 3C polypeptide 4 isoform X2 [Rhineura floridana]
MAAAAAAAEGNSAAAATSPPPPPPEGNDEDGEEAESPQEEEEDEEEEAAAAGPSSGVAGGNSAGFRLTAVRRDPAVRLQHGVSGLEPLAWSEDHRVSVSTARSIAVLEQLSDIQGGGSNSSGGAATDLVIHRTAVPAPAAACHLKVGSKKEVAECKEKFASSKDPTVSQTFMLDRVFNPEGKSLPSMRGFKYASWSPLGCDANGRCLLAALTVDNRLTIHTNLNRLQWVQLVDLTEFYGERLYENSYRLCKGEGPRADLGDFSEFQRRHSMQTPVRMEWSGICTTQQVKHNNECRDVGSVLLAVIFENGNIAVWQFQLPFVGKESITSCNTIESGISSPSVLSWWEYEHSNRKMSGLIVGSAFGPVKILPVNLKAVKGYFTLRQPVVLWQEMDQLPVHSIKSIPLYHPYQKCSCSLVVAARGCYVFWCLLLISKAGLNVHNSHVTGLHSLPIISMTADKQNGTIYTCSIDGKVRQLIPIFTDVALKFEHQLLKLSEVFGSVRTHGIAVSPCGAYLAVVTTEGMTNGLHPITKSYQVQFVTLKTFEEAAAQLLESSVQNLFRQVDLTDLVRWKILKDKHIPRFLQEALDKKIESFGSTYFWRFKLFLLRILYQSLQKAPSEALWRPTHEDTKVLIAHSPGTDGSEEPQQDEGTLKQDSKQNPSNVVSGVDMDDLADDSLVRPSDLGGREPMEEKLLEIQAQIEAVEMHLTREHMKRVLGEVYLHTWITENTSIPTRGVCDFLMCDESYDDRTARVLIGHILKKMNKQTFPEHCSLCKEILPFADRKQAVCSNGHIWLRCFLTYQACQSLVYRRCLLRDSIARHPTPEGIPTSEFQDVLAWCQESP